MKKVMLLMLICSLLCTLFVSVCAYEPVETTATRVTTAFDLFEEPVATTATTTYTPEAPSMPEFTTGEDSDPFEEPEETTTEPVETTYEPACTHANTTTTTTPASCTKAGAKVTTCNDCGVEVDRITLTAPGHNYSIEGDTVPASCTQDGYTTKFCPICGDEKSTPIPGGHDWKVEMDEPATCQAPSKKITRCTKCGISEVVEGTTTAAHDYVVTSDTATCKEAGAKTSTCTVCGAEKTEISPKKTTHTYGEWVTVTVATCTKAGSKKATCTVCGTQKTETIAAGSHNYGTVKYITRLPTTSATGYYVQYCLNCGKKGTTGSIPKFTSSASSKDLSDYTLPPIVATPDSGDVAAGKVVKLSFPTGTNSNITSNVTIYYALDGMSPTSSAYREKYTTSGIKITEDTIIKAFAVYDDDQYDIKKSSTYTFSYEVEECPHEYEETATVGATCTEGGYKEYTCTICGYVNKEELEGEEALGHTMSEWTTVSQGGESVETRWCTRCYYSEARSVVPKNAAIISVDSGTVLAGGTVSVDVEIKNNSGFGGIRFGISFDETVLTLTGVDTSDSITTFTESNIDGANSSGIVWINTVELQNVVGDGKIAKLIFKVADEAEVGTLPLKVDLDDESFYYDGHQMLDLALAKEDGEIEIIDYIYGDADYSGELNIRDAAIILQYLAGWDVEINLDAADVDRSGRVTIRDAASILQHLAGWDVALG